MKYTIKQLAEYSGVSTRTLRFYDKIGLLAPASYNSSGYRYYGEKELLLLQQILFFRELGFQLKEIKNIVCADEFDQLRALRTHKAQLIEKIKMLKKLTRTIDKTVKHLEGNIDMKNKEHELFKNFDLQRQKDFINYLKENTDESIDDLLAQCQSSAEKFSEEELIKMNEDRDRWTGELKKCICDGKSPRSKDAQKIIAKFFQRHEQFCNPTWTQVMTIVEAEVKHPECQAHFKSIHPDFADYYLAAVTCYIENHSKK